MKEKELKIMYIESDNELEEGLIGISNWNNMDCRVVPR